MNNIISQWNIKNENITEVQKNVWKVDKTYYLKANDNKEWIRNLQLYKVLRNIGIPAPEVLSRANGEDYLELNNTYYFLTRKLKGSHLRKEEVINNHELARSVGRTIAKLHKAFSTITTKNIYSFYDNDFLNELKGWVKKDLEKYATDSFTYSIFNNCVDELEIVYTKLERHLIHRDLHLGNLLFEGNKITGYIDFDLSQINARIFDIAYLLVGWIVGEINDDKFMNQWQHAVQFVIEGYQEEQNLLGIEVNALGIMMCSIEMLFVAYFYGLNDAVNASKSEECLKWLWRNREVIWKNT
jgi:Ser/Thr protein kinase RdoA (MazF antagonist)